MLKSLKKNKKRVKNFDADLIEPFLVQGAIIKVDGEHCNVVDMDNDLITVRSSNGIIKKITDNDWSPIYLDKEWIKKFGLEEGMILCNARTKVEWILKSISNVYYIESKNGIAIPINSVNQLQEMYYKLTGKDLNLKTIRKRNSPCLPESK